jgi:hypothetical protein
MRPRKQTQPGKRKLSSAQSARERNRRYSEKHRDAINARARERYAANRELAREKQRQWRKDNQERSKEIHRKYREKNRISIAARHRDWSGKNADAVAGYRRARKLLKADEVRAYAREWARQKRRNEPLFLLISRVRNRTRQAIRSSSARRSRRTLELVGCTCQQLADHISSLFADGMCWENMPMWHIDHIVPVCAFDLSDEEQQAAAFHYTNLQPLWKKDNLTKSRKVPGQVLFGFAYAARIADKASATPKKRRKNGRKHRDD